MTHLQLTGVSADRRRLLLVDEAGSTYSLDLDHRLTLALRTASPRPGTTEKTMDSVLRPRDIQARIRHGESPESVAEAARTDVARIMPFAGPVLDERAHVAQRAQQSSVRGRSSAAAARTLGEAVAGHLRGLDVDPDVVEWDSWRREDGRWVLQGLYAAGATSGDARFVFDMPGNFVLLDNDDARWLVGDATPPTTEIRDDLHAARQRRLGSIDEPGADAGADAGAEIGDDALDLVGDEPTLPEEPIEVAVDEPAEVPAAETAEDEAPAEPVEAPKPARTPRRPVRKSSRGRASVPSWDEIMFGGGKD